MNFTRKFLSPSDRVNLSPGIDRTPYRTKNDIIFETGYSSSGNFKFTNLLYIWYWKEFLTVTKSEMFLVKKTLFIGHLW